MLDYDVPSGLQVGHTVSEVFEILHEFAAELGKLIE
jgi:hypothetical protein